MPFLGVQPAESALTTGDLADDIVTEAKMANDAIGLTELKAGTDGEIISWDSSGNPVAIAVGTAGHFLKSAGAGAQPVFAAAPGLVLQVLSMTIAEATGTTAIPMDDTAPANDEGTEIGTQAITLDDDSNKVLISGAINAGNSDDGQFAVIALFRDSTCINVRATNSAGSDSANVIAFAHLDSPATDSQITYSTRVGRKGAGTWFIGTIRGDGAAQDYGDLADDGLLLLEISA